MEWIKNAQNIIKPNNEYTSVLEEYKKHKLVTEREYIILRKLYKDSNCNDIYDFYNDLSGTPIMTLVDKKNSIESIKGILGSLKKKNLININYIGDMHYDDSQSWITINSALFGIFSDKEFKNIINKSKDAKN